MATSLINSNRQHSNTIETGEWVYASCIQSMAAMGALLHDIGKSTKGFQQKLMKGTKGADPYRHEWISLKIFSLMVQDCKTDREWLNRLVTLPQWLKNADIEKQVLVLDPNTPVIGDMPPLAQWLAWLIVTHHRLPPLKEVFLSASQIERFISASRPSDLRGDLHQFYSQLGSIDYWVKNPKSLLPTSEGGLPQKQLKEFWQFKDLVIHSPAWQQALKYWSEKALSDITLMQLSENAYTEQPQKPTITNPLLLHLSRLCLMIGDHNYSSLNIDDERCIKIEESFSHLAANTLSRANEEGRQEAQAVAKQSLEEHLIGVSEFAARLAQNLPVISHQMPCLKNHDKLAKPTQIERFKWQNKSFDLAVAHQQASQEHGFFGVNMASTGAGKTIGNARIMYGLANPEKGARFTIALGLRVLTLQTGLSFRKNIGLSDSQLAILVGGSANKQLFEINQDLKTGEFTDIAREVDGREGQVFGSESSEELVDELVDSAVLDESYNGLNLDTVIANPKARDLLFAPIVTCTVDHLIQASECKRGGKYIAPWLRLLSSDLILDEPDDFDQADLPALTRLMYLTGMTGGRVLLSSATLTPDLVTGLFNAYLSGRHLYNNSQNKPAPKVVCAWFDEQPDSAIAVDCASTNDFFGAHSRFSAKRATYLAKQPIRRKAQILPLKLPMYDKGEQASFYTPLAQTLVKGAVELHSNHAFTHPDTQQRISIGLVRIANVNNITGICQQLFDPSKVDVPEDTALHVACYHAKQLLLLRNALENKLDRILDRNNDAMPFEHSEVYKALQENPAKNHIFIVLATPVAEVGRDHDYDWAIVEPSSMRSIIQLAGRVWRHRPQKTALQTNILLLQYNIRYFRQSFSKRPVFTRPGFETTIIKPVSYDLADLITKEQMQCIDARPRIICSTQGEIANQQQAQSLAELEHLVMKQLMNSNKLNHVNAYYHPVTAANRVHTHLQQISPFRAGTPQQDWLLIPDLPKEPNAVCTDNCGFNAYYKEDVIEQGVDCAGKRNQEVVKMNFEFNHPQIKPWLDSSAIDVLRSLQEHQPTRTLQSLAIAYASVSLEQASKGWLFHEYFGFVKC